MKTWFKVPGGGTARVRRVGGTLWLGVMQPPACSGRPRNPGEQNCPQIAEGPGIQAWESPFASKLLRKVDCSAGQNSQKDN